MASMVLAASAALADSDAQDSGSPGDIIVLAADAEGAPVKGCRVRLILPGPDGSLEKAPNILFESIDGDKTDADGARDGAVVFLRKDIESYAKAGAGLLLDVTAEGFAPALDQEREYSDEQANLFAIPLQKQKSAQK